MSKYYDFSPLLSRNGVYNFVVGGRGIGKTYGAKVLAVRRAIKHGEMFIYMRRYKGELDMSARAFFADIEHLFPDYVFERRGQSASYALASTPAKDRVWKQIGYFIPLSIASNVKSVAYPKVKRIIYDEFISDKNRRELPNEYEAFLNFFNTVDRGQDRCIVLFLANSVTMMNDYFLNLNIRPDQLGEWSRHNDGFVIVHFPESAEFKNAFMQSRFGRFIDNTDYADYAVGNQFDDAHASLVSKKGTKANYLYTFDTKHGMFSVWMDMTTGEFYAQGKRPRNEFIYVFETSRMREGVMLIAKTDPRVKILKQAFRAARMMFDEPVTRNAFSEVFK